MKEAYLSECLEKFHNLPERAQEIIGGFEACLEIKRLEELYNISLGFAVILIAIDELFLSDLPKYLKLKFNLELLKGEEIRDILDEKIFTPVLEIFDDEDDVDDTAPDDEDDRLSNLATLPLSERRELILDIFEGRLLETIKADQSYLKELNVAVFLTFNQDDDLEDRVESMLYNNQERLGEGQIVLDGHPASPSVANWLKDFIKRYGSDLFSEVSLAEYLTQSINAKKLNPEEKELLRKLLRLYRNLVFFPESMEGILIDDWEIFPTNKDRGDSLSGLKTKLKNISEPELSIKQKTILDLQKSLTKYSPNSLEYKAIYQEINRLNRS